MDVLTITDLTKQYQHFTALAGLTMHVPRGAIYGLVGQNGAGKTTLIRQVCGLQTPSGGTVTLFGIDHREPGIVQARQRIGAVVETPSVYLDMTAAANLRQQYQILGLPADETFPRCSKRWAWRTPVRRKLNIFPSVCASASALPLHWPADRTS